MGEWGQTHLANLFGTSNVMIGRYLNGLSYPTVQMMQKFEIVLGWPIAEQAPLIPPYWKWPDQPQSSKYKSQENASDLRYAMKLRQVLNEWAAANPRTQRLQEIRLHPALDAKGRTGKSGGGRPRKHPQGNVTKITPD